MKSLKSSKHACFLHYRENQFLKFYILTTYSVPKLATIRSHFVPTGLQKYPKKQIAPKATYVEQLFDKIGLDVRVGNFGKIFKKNSVKTPGVNFMSQKLRGIPPGGILLLTLIETFPFFSSWE